MQEPIIVDTLAIERQARALRAAAALRMLGNLRAWLGEKFSGAARPAGKTA